MRLPKGGTAIVIHPRASIPPPPPTLCAVVKVVRASTIIQRWENSFAIQSSKMTLYVFGFGTLVLLHWISCLFSLLAQLQTSQRVGFESQIEPVLLSLMETHRECTGCIPSDESTAAICAQQCLTWCERDALAALRNQPEKYIFSSEPWTCRAASNGLLTPDFATDPFSVYITGLLVAMLQLVGGVATIGPVNPWEYLFFFVGIRILVY